VIGAVRVLGECRDLLAATKKYGCAAS